MDALRLVAPAPSPQLLEFFSSLQASALQFDAAPPFSDQSQVEITKALTDPSWPERLKIFQLLNQAEPLGLAIFVKEGQAWVLEAALLPAYRGRGWGRFLLEESLKAFRPEQLKAWVHGGSDPQSPAQLAALTLAASLGWELERELYKLALPLTDQVRAHLQAAALETPLPAGLLLRPYQLKDASAWVALNARAFADHPEQGRLTEADLSARLAQDWFRPEGFFLAEEEATGALAGYHWTKIPQSETPQSEVPQSEIPAQEAAEQLAEGEVYALGIDPSWQGRGLGRSLTLSGLAYLAQARSEQARSEQTRSEQTQDQKTHSEPGRLLDRLVLYVDASNTPAFSLYSSLGFSPLSLDRQYRV